MCETAKQHALQKVGRLVVYALNRCVQSCATHQGNHVDHTKDCSDDYEVGRKSHHHSGVEAAFSSMFLTAVLLTSSSDSALTAQPNLTHCSTKVLGSGFSAFVSTSAGFTSV
eukprot:4855088-Amphidinium_carterae.2